MKAVQTCWLDRSNNYRGGWLDKRFHLYSLALSVSQSVKYFDQIELIGNADSTKVLIEKLDLPYSSFSLLKYPPGFENVWVLKKVSSYACQQEKFLHIDSDAYAFGPPDAMLLEAPLIAQNAEFDHPYYLNAFKKIIHTFSFIPEYLRKDKEGRLWAVNAGILGGNNFGFFRVYEEEVLNFLQRNKKHLGEIDDFSLNTFVEQCIFKQLADYHSVPIAYQLKESIGYPYNYRLDRFFDLPNQCNYIHVMNYKQNPAVCEQLAQRLRLENPDLYERVNQVVRQLDARTHFIAELEQTRDETAQTPDNAPPFFARTTRALEQINEDGGKPGPKDEEKVVAAQVRKMPKSRTKTVLGDLFSFEKQKKRAVHEGAAGAAARLRQYEQAANRFWSHPMEYCLAAHIRPSPLCHRLESQWCWAEANEFGLQKQEIRFEENCKREPAYYEVVLLPYVEQNTWRECLLSPLEMLLFDAIAEGATIEACLNAVGLQIAEHQPQINIKEIEEHLMSRIRFFSYFGLLTTQTEANAPQEETTTLENCIPA